jgi:hypothetical protein
MTIERRLIVGIDDIKGVSFECLGCRARNTMLPDKIGEMGIRLTQVTPTGCGRTLTVFGDG